MVLQLAAAIRASIWRGRPQRRVILTDHHDRKAGRREGGQLRSPLLYSPCSFITAMNVENVFDMAAYSVRGGSHLARRGLTSPSLKSQEEIDAPPSLYDSSVQKGNIDSQRRTKLIDRFVQSKGEGE